MATETELAGGFSDPDFRLRTQVAIVIVAAEIVAVDDTVAPYSQAAGAHALRVQWANAVLANTGGEAETMHKLLLGIFNALAIATILSSSLSTVTDKVRENVDELAAVRYGSA